MAPLVESPGKNPCCRVQRRASAHSVSAAGAASSGEPLFVGMGAPDTPPTTPGCGADCAHAPRATAIERWADHAVTLLGALSYRG